MWDEGNKYIPDGRLCLINPEAAAAQISTKHAALPAPQTSLSHFQLAVQIFQLQPFKSYSKNPSMLQIHIKLS